MKKLLDFLVYFTKKISNGEKINFSGLTNEDMDIFSDILNCFEFVICYPDEKSFHNEEIGRKTFEKTELFSNLYYIGSKSYYELVKENKEIENLLENEFYSPNILDNKRYARHIRQALYYKEGNFIHEYFRYIINTKHLVSSTAFFKDYKFPISNTKTVNVSYKAKVRIPLIIDKQDLKEFESNIIYNENEDIYKLRLGDYLYESKNAICSKFLPNFHNMNSKYDFVKFNANHSYIAYIKKGDDLVSQSMMDNLEYDTYIKEREDSIKFKVINKDGEILDNSKIDLGVILHYIRNDIVHNINWYKFSIKHNELSDYNGMFYITDWKDKQNSRAIIFPDNLLEALAKVNRFNYNIHEISYTTVYCPDIDVVLVNENQWKDYLNKCKKIVLTNVAGIDRWKLFTSTNYFLEKYDNTIDLQAYLEENLSKIFSNIKVKINKLENINLLLQKILSNPFFLKKSPQKFYGNQKNALIFILKDFYDFDIVSSNALLYTGKRKNIYINEKNLITLMINLYNDMLHVLNNEKNEINFSLFRDELYISICTFLIFTNLIYNDFNEDLNGDFSRINSEEKKNIESKLDINMFKDFTFINKNINGHDRTSKVTTLKDMKDVIKKLRDNIAHFSVKVKFSKSGNPEDNILLFGYENSASIYYTISCKNLIDFLMNPIFLEYKSKKNEVVILNNYDELKDLIIEKIKHS